MTSHLADYVIARLRRPPSDGRIVPGSTPVLSFGNPSEVVIATLGLNPSRHEFLDPHGRELTGNARRFETLTSLGVRDLATASDTILHRVANACNGYFAVNPYKRWFDQLEPVLQSVGASYYNGSACHLDLVQWATDPVWGQIPDRSVQDRMAAEDAAFLQQQIMTGSFQFLLINGRTVVRQFEAAMGGSLRKVDSISGSSIKSDLLVGRLPIGTRVIAWSVNVQLSRGVCNTLRARLARRVGELGQDSSIA